MDTNGITGMTIGCAIRVSIVLGTGYLEKVYENALAHEIRKSQLRGLQQAQIAVVYDGVEVGHYSPDLLVEREIIVELKAAREIDEMNEARLLS